MSRQSLMTFKRVSSDNLLRSCLSQNGLKPQPDFRNVGNSRLFIVRSVHSLIANRSKTFSGFKSTISKFSKTLSSVSQTNQNETNVTKTLSNYFGLERQQIQEIYHNFPQLKSQDVSLLENKIVLLKSKDVCSPEVALKRTWLLTTPRTCLTSGLSILNKNKLLDSIRAGNSHLFVMFVYDKSDYRLICKRFKSGRSPLFADFDERLEFFKQNLDINGDTFCSIAKQNISILTKDFNHIRTVMNLLKDHISKDDLIRDHWIFIHNISLIEKRIREAKEVGRPFLAWHLRAPEPVWYGMLQRWNDDRQVLGGDDITTFLAKKLKVDRQSVELLIERSARTLRVRPAKLDQVISLLFKFGYTSSDILSCPRVLSYSSERIEQRLKSSKEKPRPRLTFVLYSEKKLKNKLKSAKVSTQSV